MESNNGFIARIAKDMEAFNSRVQTAPDGTRLNPVKLDGLASTDPVSVGKRLNEIADNARTHGIHEPVGSLYGFTLLVKTETTNKDGFEMHRNRFFVKGEGEILYHYNHGQLAVDPKTAAVNFLNALDTMPALLKKYETDNEQLKKDVPTLKAIVEGEWKKEGDLKALKGELVVMDRRIEASLNPVASSVGIAAPIPKEDAAGPLHLPDRLQTAKEVMGGRLVIAQPAPSPAVPPERKGIKI